jgi:hypothetical protein
MEKIKIIEDKLEYLRKLWKQYPDKRYKYELMAIPLKILLKDLYIRHPQDKLLDTV